MTDQIDTARLRELAEKATPGPWEAKWDGDEPWDPDEEDLPDEITVGAGTYIASGGRSWATADLLVEHDVSGADLSEIEKISSTAEFIAAVDPQTVLALLDEIERLRGAQQVWRDRFGTHWESLPDGDLRARIGARYTREEAEESYGPLEPVEGDGE